MVDTTSATGSFLTPHPPEVAELEKTQAWARFSLGYEREVVAFHGTSKTQAAAIIASQAIHASNNSYDWIGHGVYFWEYAPHRAYAWAQQEYRDEAAVVMAIVKLGVCLDLTDTRFTHLLKMAHDRLRTRHVEQGVTFPTNAGKRRDLDCLVVNYLCQHILPTVETVRAPFIEGDEVYPNAGFFSDSHIQVCVRAAKNIVSDIKLWSHEQ